MNKICDLCSNPPPYQCAECDDISEPVSPMPAVIALAIRDPWAGWRVTPNPIWIGSGEDFHPAM